MRKAENLSCRLSERVKVDGLQTICVDGLALDKMGGFSLLKTSRREGNMGSYLVKMQPSSPRRMKILNSLDNIE